MSLSKYLIQQTLRTSLKTLSNMFIVFRSFIASSCRLQSVQFYLTVLLVNLTTIALFPVLNVDLITQLSQIKRRVVKAVVFNVLGYIYTRTLILVSFWLLKWC